MIDIKKTTLLSDMDGTLLSSSGVVSEGNKEAVRALIEAGGHFGIATGRGHVNALNFIEGVEINAPCILYNGAMLYDFSEKRVLKMETLPKEELKSTLEWVLLNHPGVMVHIYGPDTCHLVSREEDADEKILADHQPAVFSDLEVVMEEPWIKVLLAGRNEALLSIEKELEKSQKGRLRWVYSADIYLEILPLNVSKASMIKAMKEIHGEDHLVIAMGDFYNDLELIRDADIGVAMGNAPDDIKAEADVVSLTNDEDGVAWVIQGILSGELEKFMGIKDK